MLDVIIVGGGPAGLSAALTLGRCLRKVVVFDHGKPRNFCAEFLHGYLTRDGISPQEFLRIAQNDLKKYEVPIIDDEVTEARAVENGFCLSTKSGKTYHSKKLLLATGVVDEVPKIPGINALYGKSVFNCPYCEGWETRHSRLAVYARGVKGLNLSRSLLNWSKDVILFSDGPCEMTEEDLKRLMKLGITLREEKVRALKGNEGKLTHIELENGELIERDFMYFNTGSFIRSRLLEQLGCPFTEHKGVPTEKYERTEVPGLYVAGNILREVQLVIVAAAQGVEAAFGINVALTKESFA